MSISEKRIVDSCKGSNQHGLCTGCSNTSDCTNPAKRTNYTNNDWKGRTITNPVKVGREAGGN